MPPKSAGGKLPDAVIQDFEKWVGMGAPDPRNGAAKVVKKYDSERARSWWSFQPRPRRPPSGEGHRVAEDGFRSLSPAALEAKG